MPQGAKLTWNGPAVNEKTRDAGVRGLRNATEHLLGVSRRQVPHEEGDLERSGVASVDAGDLTGAVSYDTPYAVYQHETPDLRHDEGRKWKYLEDPHTAESDRMLELVAAEIRRELGK